MFGGNILTSNDIPYGVTSSKLTVQSYYRQYIYRPTRQHLSVCDRFLIGRLISIDDMDPDVCSYRIMNPDVIPCGIMNLDVTPCGNMNLDVTPYGISFDVSVMLKTTHILF